MSGIRVRDEARERERPHRRVFIADRGVQVLF